MKSEMLLKNSAGPCKHNTVYTDQDDHREQTDGASDLFAEEVTVKVFIGFRFYSPSNDHHFCTQPYEQYS